MKKKKLIYKLTLILLIAIMSIYYISNAFIVQAQVRQSSLAQISSTLGQATAGDTIQVTDKSISGLTLTIDKDITIDFNNATLSNSKIIINGSAHNVILKNATFGGMIIEDHTFFDVQTPVNLTFSNFLVGYGSRTPSSGAFDSDVVALRLQKEASGSTVKLENSKIYGIYDAILVESENTKITLDNTEAEGRKAVMFDGSKLDNEAKLAKNNVLEVLNNSEINGGSPFAVAEANDEEMLSIKSQDGLQVKVQDSILSSNKVKNKTDLIALDDGKSKNVDIKILGNSQLLDGNQSEESQIFSFGNTPVGNNNKVYIEKGVSVALIEEVEITHPDEEPGINIEKVTQTRATTVEERYKDGNDYVVVGIYDDVDLSVLDSDVPGKLVGNLTIKPYAKQSTIPDNDLPQDNRENYRLKGLYTDDKFQSDFNKQNQLSEHIEIYPKYVRLYKVSIKDKKYTLEEGQKLDDLSEQKQEISEALNSLKDSNKHFLKYVIQDTDTEFTTSTEVHQNITVNALHNIKVTISSHEYYIDDGAALNTLEENAKQELEKLKDVNKHFVTYQDETQSPVTMETVPTKNITITAKHNIGITIGDQEYYIEENQKLSNLEGEGKQALEALKQVEGKTFDKFVDADGEEVDDKQFNKNTTITPKYNVNIKIGGQDYPIPEGETLQKLQEEGQQALETLKTNGDKTFSRLVDEDGTTIDENETTFDHHTTITAKFKVKVSISGQTYLLEEGMTLNDLEEPAKSALKALESVDGKHFVEYQNSSSNEKLTMESVVNEDITIVGKYNIAITIGEQEFYIEENQTLSNLNEQGKQALNALKNINGKTFVNFVDDEGTEVQESQSLTKNTTIKGKYTVNITINNNNYAIPDGGTLNDLSDEGKSALTTLKQKENQTFSRLVDNEGTTIDETKTKFTRHTTITAKFKVKVTIGSQAYEIEEGLTITSLDEAGQQALNALKNVTNKVFVNFKDEDNNFIGTDTPITKNITITAVYNIKVTIAGREYLLDENKTLSDLIGPGATARDALKNVSDRHFKKFVDENGTEIDEKNTTLDHNIILSAKYYVKIRIGDKDYELDEGLTLNSLSSEGKEALAKLKESSTKTFANYVNSAGEKVEENKTPMTKDTTITAKYTVNVKINEQTFVLNEGDTLSKLDANGKKALEALKNVFGKDLVRLLDETNATIDEAKTPINKHSTITGEYKMKVPNVTYQTHVQGTGWQQSVMNGASAGTTGAKKRLEAIKISLDNVPYTGSITYRTHVQSYGWQDYVQDGALSGTEGKKKRLEAIQINLTGDMATHYDIYYRVHAEKFGWLEWAKNGEKAGTAGYGYRLEAIQIVLVEKGQDAPGPTNLPYVQKYVLYQTHVQSYGWQDTVYDGLTSGTEGQKKRLEAIKINLTNKEYTGDIEYRTHVQTYGWQDYVKNGALSGTEGKKKRLEAIQIRLTGEMAEHYDIYYRVHAEKFGWLGWAKNDEKAGTAGYKYRLEAIQIVLVKKDGEAPGPTENAYYEK